MKFVIAIALFVTSSQAFACRPNIYAIKHRILMAAIQSAFEEMHLTVQDLKAKSIEDLKFSWINTNSGHQCHDRENAVVKLAYQVTDANGTATQKDVKVTLQFDRGTTTSARVE